MQDIGESPARGFPRWLGWSFFSKGQRAPNGHPVPTTVLCAEVGSARQKADGCIRTGCRGRRHVPADGRNWEHRLRLCSRPESDNRC